ncbi:MAG: hypothetical protein IPI60_17970 [Saprospiraceae bacterium]|nr:hypothetical protein [Saprospiraceae bacterium]
MEYLNFKEISQQVQFMQLLNWLNIPFKETDKELKGDGFIVTKEKNLYFSTKDKTQKGSVINFLTHHKQIDLRAAALEIKKQFLIDKPKEEKKLPDLELHYTEQLMTFDITEDLAEEYSIGYVKQRSIMAGRIALLCKDLDGSTVGYVGYKDGNWLFPKGFQRPVWNLNNVNGSEVLILTTDPFDALKIIAMGYPYTASLLGNSMTDSQFQAITEASNLHSVMLIHKEPHNIASRLYERFFVRAISPTKPIREFNKYEFLDAFNPP